MARKGYRTAQAVDFLWSWSGAAKAVEIAKIAKTGDPAPGAGNGVTFNASSNLFVNAAGIVAFGRTLGNGERAICPGGCSMESAHGS